MDKTQLDNLSLALKNSQLFFNIVAKHHNNLVNGIEITESDKKDLVNMLSINNKTNQNIIDIFSEKKSEISKIRELNDIINKLELKIGEGVTPLSISSYIINLNKEIYDKFKKEGLNVKVESSISRSLNIKLRYIKSFSGFKESSLNMFNNDKEKEKHINKLTVLEKISKNSDFEFSKQSDLVFSDNNVELLENKIKNILSDLGELRDIKYNIEVRTSKNEDSGENKNKRNYYLSDVEIIIILLDSDKQILKLFSKA